MQKLKIKLKYCYGITSLEHEFDFSNRHQYVVYAPNGVMKSSLAQVFKDISEGKPSSDRIFKDRETIREITDETGHELSADSVFVVEPYNETYRSNRVSTLLVNERLRQRYDAVRRAIDEKKDALVKALSASSGMKKDVETTLAMDLVSDPEGFYTALDRVKGEVRSREYSYLSDIKYAQIFSEKAAEQLASPDFREGIAEYMEVYDQLLDQSSFFRKGAFNHNNAADVAKSLKENGFFKASHSVYVNNRDVRKEINTEADLEKYIADEKESIVTDPRLRAAFEKIDKILIKNADMRAFRSYLALNDKILPELAIPGRLRQRLWISYLTENMSLFEELLTQYETGKSELDAIVQLAKQESTRWLAVLQEFNERFSVPFIVTMENQHDVILKSEAPSIRFRFKGNAGQEIAVGENDLLRVLSNGEKRALYILNIIFEVMARRDAGLETLFLFDDIADSFDYKNKYAIVEYLRDISEVGNFYQIILTHNYDFYRTISSRLDLLRSNKLHTVKNDNGVSLKEEKYQNNPFRHWKDKIPSGTNVDFLLASTPFVRNIAEYTDNKDQEEKLTRFLHVKGDSAQLSVADLEESLKAVLHFQTDFTLPNQGARIHQLFKERAEAICALDEEEIELEGKIVLAIAIRLAAERFMIDSINDQAFVDAITKNQTATLVAKFCEKFPNERETKSALKQVNLMTPENIHLNSFMYEPILDMSNQHLKRLYGRVSGLIKPT